MDKNNNQSYFNLLFEKFSNKYELAVLTFSVYFLGLLFQVLKLIGGFTTAPKMGNLMFFSFSNSINDFCILFGVSFLFFFFSFLIASIINFFLSLINVTNNKNIRLLLLFSSIMAILFIGDKAGWNLLDIKNLPLLLFPYVLSVILVGFLILGYNFSKIASYSFLSLFLFYGFVLLLYQSDNYYGCDQLMCNESSKNCILLEYKNDKYGFTGDGDIYKLDAFTSFYTVDYFKDKIKTGTESCETE